MAQNKINNEEQGIRSRMRKYDTYTPRPGNSRSLNSTKSITAPFVALPAPKITANNANLRPTTVVKTNRPVVRQSSSSITPPSSKMIALGAVNKAQLSSGEVFPDYLDTIYGATKKKSSKLQKFVYGFGVLVLIFSCLVSAQSFINNNKAKDQIATLGVNMTRDDEGVSEGTGNEPSEEQVSAVARGAYKVSNPEDPRYLRIPDLQVFARIKNLGIDSSGAVDSPHNIYDAGWYNGSVRPGSSSGSSLILGHVSGWTASGVFKRVKDMKPGMQFEIEKGSGEKVRYEVNKIQTLPVEEVDMSNVLSTEVAGEHDLKLMTCGGKYNKDTKTFSDRVIVYAVQVK